MIGLEAAVVGPSGANWTLFGLVTVTGILGALFDSVLGATVQAIYYCPACQKETERNPAHSCGTGTTQIRGWKWLDNDWVNFACGAFGVLITLLSY